MFIWAVTATVSAILWCWRSHVQASRARYWRAAANKALDDRIASEREHGEFLRKFVMERRPRVKELEQRDHCGPMCPVHGDAASGILPEDETDTERGES